jgi:hypothetical protein
MRNDYLFQPLKNPLKGRVMSRLTISLGAMAAVAGAAAMLPTSAAAQQTTSEITVYGTDPCPRSTNGEIYVCNRRPEADRYRLPKNQQLQGSRQQRQSWARRSQALTTVGATGPGSCSTVGPGGFTGCLTQEINQARRDANEQQQSSTPPEQ